LPGIGDARAAVERRVPGSWKEPTQPDQRGEMQKTAVATVFLLAALTSAALAVDSNTSTETTRTVPRSPVSEAVGSPRLRTRQQTPYVPSSTVDGRAVVHYDAYYDRAGNRIETGGADAVGDDSLYFKRYNRTDTLYGCPKSQVPDPTPASCRTGFAFIDRQNRVGMDPAGMYIYEVDVTSLRD
jgi:hypothetical protein